MSFRILADILEHAPYEKTALMVLIALGQSCWEEDGLAWLTLERLAKHARASDSAVRAALRRLEDHGVIAPVDVEGGDARVKRCWRIDRDRLLELAAKGLSGADLDAYVKQNYRQKLAPISGGNSEIPPDFAKQPPNSGGNSAPLKNNPVSTLYTPPYPPVAPEARREQGAPGEAAEARPPSETLPEPLPAVGPEVGAAEAVRWGECRQVLGKRLGEGWVRAWLDHVALWQADTERIVIVGRKRLHLDTVERQAGDVLLALWRREVEFHHRAPGRAAVVAVKHWFGAPRAAAG